ncbi:MAG TPA: TrmH family RNA methyltransferase, partial [Longimicrobiales bacterium]|nr:TrmH family RNA methyltransferase [Longimicrobiales bacterium]
GGQDPWHPAALRGGAGLQFALPVLRVETLPGGGRPLVALHPEGDPLRPGVLPPGALLAFGSERRGLSAELLERTDLRVSIPMRAGVSSLNLATAVAITLYVDRL